MIYLKTAIILVVVMLAALLLLVMVTFNPDKELNRALKFYLEGNFEEAENVLEHMQSSLAPMQYYLYKGYIDRARNHLDLSIKDLDQAEKDAIEHANFPLLLEILLNEAYNAYLSNNATALSSAVKKAMKYGGPNQDWVLVFRGIVEYNEGDYDKAISMWKLDASRVPLSPWMEKPFQKTFTNYWFLTHLSRSNIEEGKFAAGRQMLEGLVSSLSGEQLDQVLFLMGYSYAKEAAGKEPVDAIPYYKLALAYFNKIPFQSEKYALARETLITQVYGQTKVLMDGSDYKNLSYYLTLLDLWHGQKELALIKDTLTAQFNRSVTLNSIEQTNDIYAVLKLIIPEGAERQSLEQSMQGIINKTALENLDQQARSGQLFLEDTNNSMEVSSVNETEYSNPLSALIPVQALIDKVVNDRHVNPHFNVERSTDLQKAHRLLTNFTENYQESPQAYVMLGQVSYLLGDFAGAAKAYEKAILLDTRNPLNYRYMALVYEEVGQAQDAILILLQGLKYAPKNADIWEQLAGLYLKTGNELDALPSYREALRIDPDRYNLYLDLGRLQVKLEMPEEASLNLQKFLSQHPDDKDALRLLLMALYNPLVNDMSGGLSALDRQRDEIYERLYKIAPEDAEKIRKSYRAPPPVVSPPPEPEPNLPFLPQ